MRAPPPTSPQWTLHAPLPPKQMPDGLHHLRARGFLAFEFTSAPAEWTSQYTFVSALYLNFRCG